MSPSSRAEWVEISITKRILSSLQGLRPRGRSGLKSDDLVVVLPDGQSPSSRAEWVEIGCPFCTSPGLSASPSSRAEWVEITFTHDTAVEKMSPSSRAEWVEMPVSCNNHWHIASPSSWAEWVEIW